MTFNGSKAATLWAIYRGVKKEDIRDIESHYSLDGTFPYVYISWTLKSGKGASEKIDFPEWIEFIGAQIYNAQFNIKEVKHKKS